MAPVGPCAIEKLRNEDLVRLRGALSRVVADDIPQHFRLRYMQAPHMQQPQSKIKHLCKAVRGGNKVKACRAQLSLLANACQLP
eukprot:CAMPEP_0170642540 /NCGR_PEP_ID=MMETSP0224-20130122/41383_1 /TAXON_ID=285029 /ORGANISM="Togula jolla, Strain CCCM 725" /LENGTH=83 /DNA_ID=CAMNT_0010973261 /DNA_START=771 /DNA_END=1022 /DNA_ORIENTATION=+